jgi:hypothetical protein
MANPNEFARIIWFKYFDISNSYVTRGINNNIYNSISDLLIEPRDIITSMLLNRLSKFERNRMIQYYEDHGIETDCFLTVHDNGLFSESESQTVFECRTIGRMLS